MVTYKKYFIKTIKNYFPDKYKEILLATETNYAIIAPDIEFIKTSKNPIDKRLDFSSYFLALIKTLDAQGETFDRIRIICLEIVTEFVRPKNKIQQLVKRIPPKLLNTWLAKILLKQFNKIISKPNKEGFVATIITNSKETYGLGYGIDILECGICKLFNKHKYPKYTSILCEVDEITSGLAGLKLIRSGTIASGADKCDFRFKKINQRQ